MTYVDERNEPSSDTDLLDFFYDTRTQTESLTAPLSDEDMGLQSMEDASPPKWHLAHTTWFFEDSSSSPICPVTGPGTSASPFCSIPTMSRQGRVTPGPNVDCCPAKRNGSHLI